MAHVAHQALVAIRVTTGYRGYFVAHVAHQALVSKIQQCFSKFTNRVIFLIYATFLSKTY